MPNLNLSPRTETAVEGAEGADGKSRERPRSARNTYIFPHGKLIEIGINLDSIQSCGDDDSASDEGWRIPIIV